MKPMVVSTIDQGCQLIER